MQRKVNSRYAKKYEEKHGHPPDFSRGVDGVGILNVEKYEDQWDKIIDAIA